MVSWKDLQKKMKKEQILYFSTHPIFNDFGIANSFVQVEGYIDSYIIEVAAAAHVFYKHLESGKLDQLKVGEDNQDWGTIVFFKNGEYKLYSGQKSAQVVEARYNINSKSEHFVGNTVEYPINPRPMIPMIC